MLKVYAENDADAVFGSRFAGGEVRRVLLFRHQIGNKRRPFCAIWFRTLTLPTRGSCYKAVRTSLLKSIPLEAMTSESSPSWPSNSPNARPAYSKFPSITMDGPTRKEEDQLARRPARARCDHSFALTDHVFVEDEYGSQILGRLGVRRALTAGLPIR